MLGIQFGFYKQVWYKHISLCQVAGGYYGDAGAECQVFHICAGGPNGELINYSFLCPNGTIFNQGHIFQHFTLIAIKIENLPQTLVF